MPPARRAPADHLAPAEHRPFTFTGRDGATHELPPPSDALLKIDGRTLRNAVLDGDTGEVALAFRCVEAVEPGAEVLDALYALPAPETSRVLVEWLRSRDASGAGLPES